MQRTSSVTLELDMTIDSADESMLVDLDGLLRQAMPIMHELALRHPEAWTESGDGATNGYSGRKTDG